MPLWMVVTFNLGIDLFGLVPITVGYPVILPVFFRGNLRGPRINLAEVQSGASSCVSLVLSPRCTKVP